MSDPFRDLELFMDEPTPMDLAAAYARRARTIGPAAARSAMDTLRDPASRAAAASTSPSMSPAARAARARRAAVVDEEVIAMVLQLLSIAVDQIDDHAAAEARAPRPVRDPRSYVEIDESVFIP